MLKEQEQWQTVRSFTGGINTFDEAKDVADNEIVGAQNMVYDNGFIQTRPGSEKLTEPPTGAGNPLQTIVARTSDGLEYIIGVYDNKFFLWHDTNKEWVQINITYVPSTLDQPYGNVSWNNGRGDDRLYFCNGIDDMGKWLICVDTVKLDATAGSTSITLNDSTRFPDSGTVVIKDILGNDFNATFSANAANVLTLSTPLTNNVGAGASIAMSVEDKPDMQIGKILAKWQARLISSNYYGGETVLWYSVLQSPEDFTVGATVEAAGTDVIADGNGQITGLNDFGAFLAIEKEDSWHSYSFSISSDLGSKQSAITPLVNGQSIGPMSQFGVVRSQNKLMYPTRSQGFMSVEPSSTGSQVTVTPTIISQKIQPTVTKLLSYLNTKSVFFDQKAIWAVAMEGAEQNIIVIYYDTIRSAWSFVTSWAVQDWAYKDGNLYYMDNSLGTIYQVFTGGYTDNNNSYTSEFFTKRFDFNTLGQPKTEDLVYVQGYMVPETQLYVDVMMNEGGELNTQTFLLNKDTPGMLISNPLNASLGQFILGLLPFGWATLEEIGDVSFFRVYLGIRLAFGLYNIQLRFYSSNGAFYGISGVAFNPELMPVIPDNMVASPI